MSTKTAKIDRVPLAQGAVDDFPSNLNGLKDGSNGICDYKSRLK